jgi:hypothetical protein
MLKLTFLQPHVQGVDWRLAAKRSGSIRRALRCASRLTIVTPQYGPVYDTFGHAAREQIGRLRRRPAAKLCDRFEREKRGVG